MVRLISDFHAKRALAIISVLVAAFFLVGCTQESDEGAQKQSSQVQQEQTSKELTANAASGEATFLGDGKWNYEVVVQKPTPCHKVEKEVVIQESYPEQVSLNLTVSKNAEELVCVQQIEEENVTGEFKASEQAKVQLNLKKQ